MTPLRNTKIHSTRRRERVLKTVAVLPSLATLGNLVCGLGAVYVCMLSMQAAGADLVNQTLNNARLENFFPTYLSIAAYLVIGSMIFDGVDGRLARLARKTSEFGGQLDSLSDVVSFGVAPAILVLCIVHPGSVAALNSWETVYWRAEWAMAASYTCCAALRLARFNVENVADESAHLGFRGLPTPGAAWAVIGLVIFHQGLLPDIAHERVSRIVSVLLPPFTMAVGLLMVSRFRYLHLVNTLLRGRRPFRQVVALVIVGLVGLLVQFELTLALSGAAYVVSGPVVGLVRKIKGRSGGDDADELLRPSSIDDGGETFEDEDDDYRQEEPAGRREDYIPTDPDDDDVARSN